MKNLDGESLVADNPHSIAEDVIDSPVGKEDNTDTEITMLFEDARYKLEMVKEDAKRKKKQIVVELAKSLEGMIPTDTISMEITNQLRGQVSEGFVRQCLEDKYKQKIRAENARKQQKKQQSQKELRPIDDLAKVPTLNQEETADKKKMIALDVDGRAILQEDDEDKQNNEGGDDEQSTKTWKLSSTNHLALSQPQEQQKEEPEITYDHDYLNNDPGLEDGEPEEGIEEPSKSMDYNEDDDTSANSNKQGDSEEDILHFEFPLVFEDIRECIASLHRRIDKDGKVWFNGLIDRNTGEVVHAGLGKISEQ